MYPISERRWVSLKRHLFQNNKQMNKHTKTVLVSQCNTQKSNTIISSLLASLLLSASHESIRENALCSPTYDTGNQSRLEGLWGRDHVSVLQFSCSRVGPTQGRRMIALFCHSAGGISGSFQEITARSQRPEYLPEMTIICYVG